MKNLRSNARWGWRSFGQCAQAVATAGRPGGEARIDRRLQNAVSTYGQEAVGADGGFAVPPGFKEEIAKKVRENSLLGLCDQQETESNSYRLPSDETTPWQTSGGIQVSHTAEGEQMTQSKPQLKEKVLRLNKLTALVPVTEELLEDAPALEAYLLKKVPEKFGFQINLELLGGTGAGQLTGVLVAPCTVSVAKESGQAADTIQFENIISMWSRLDGASWKNAVWLINQDITPQLFSLLHDQAASYAGLPMEIPKAPVIPTQACNTLGGKGDIVLADLSQYLMLARRLRVRPVCTGYSITACLRSGSSCGLPGNRG